MPRTAGNCRHWAGRELDSYGRQRATHGACCRRHAHLQRARQHRGNGGPDPPRRARRRRAGRGRQQPGQHQRDRRQARGRKQPCPRAAPHPEGRPRRAYIAGFHWALAKGYDVLVEMDADGSHQPEELPLLLDALKHADLVLGSRWVAGGTVRNWPKSRELLSRGGNTYARLMLGIGLRDATGGYRAYRATTLRAIALDEVESQGYCFQIDLAMRAIRAGLRVVDVPCTRSTKVIGTSTTRSPAIVVEALWR